MQSAAAALAGQALLHQPALHACLLLPFQPSFCLSCIVLQGLEEECRGIPCPDLQTTPRLHEARQAVEQRPHVFAAHSACVQRRYRPQPCRIERAPTIYNLPLCRGLQLRRRSLLLLSLSISVLTHALALAMLALPKRPGEQALVGLVWHGQGSHELSGLLPTQVSQVLNLAQAFFLEGGHKEANIQTSQQTPQRGFWRQMHSTPPTV
mmetsp:Transcript_174376/g.558999  ORF Transcript_174376/g.558999 Transcript_174376/m.558999 type:complete len:208 (+) Transcript_174376:746-1369(+)